MGALYLNHSVRVMKHAVLYASKSYSWAAVKHQNCENVYDLLFYNVDHRFPINRSCSHNLKSFKTHDDESDDDGVFFNHDFLIHTNFDPLFL